MKVKVRGLVFVGFAAAVFAQSAFAAIYQNDYSTVASKKYVDDYAQEQANRVVIGNGGGTNEFASVDDITETKWNDNSLYPSMPVLKEVKDSLDAINVVGAADGYVEVAEDTGTFTLDVDPNKIANSVAAANTSSTKLVTEGAVVNYAQDKSKFDDADYDSVNETYATTIASTSANDEYPSSRNVYEFVTGKIDALAPAVGSNATAYVDFTESGNTFTVNFDQAPATTAAELTGYDASNTVNGTALTGTDAQKLVTTGAVNSMILRENNGATTIDSNSTNGTVPTSKNVYDYVEGKVSNAAYQRKLTQADTGTLYVGQYDANASGDQSTWKQLSIADADDTGGTAALANTNYVAKTVSGGVYTVNLDAAQIADSIANDASQKLVTENAVYDLVARETVTDTTTIASGGSNTMVPTVKNVYDFVNGNYQAKAAANTNTVQVGYNGGWGTLGGSTYVTVDPNSGSGIVSLTNLTAATTDFVASDDTNANTNRPKLAKAGDVYDFVMAQTNGLVIPSMPSECDTAAGNGGYCALVYGKTSGEANAPLGLMWTIMAPEPGAQQQIVDNNPAPDKQ